VTCSGSGSGYRKSARASNSREDLVVGSREPESVARKDVSDTKIENNKKKERKLDCVYENTKLVRISE